MALFFSLNDHHRDETDGDAGEILSRSDNILCPDRFRPVPPGGTGGLLLTSVCLSRGDLDEQVGEMLHADAVKNAVSAVSGSPVFSGQKGDA